MLNSQDDDSNSDPINISSSIDEQFGDDNNFPEIELKKFRSKEPKKNKKIILQKVDEYLSSSMKEKHTKKQKGLKIDVPKRSSLLDEIKKKIKLRVSEEIVSKTTFNINSKIEKPLKRQKSKSVLISKKDMKFAFQNSVFNALHHLKKGK